MLHIVTKSFYLPILICKLNKTKWQENKTNLKEKVNTHTYKITCVLI